MYKFLNFPQSSTLNNLTTCAISHIILKMVTTNLCEMLTKQFSTPQYHQKVKIQFSSKPPNKMEIYFIVKIILLQFYKTLYYKSYNETCILLNTFHPCTITTARNLTSQVSYLWCSSALIQQSCQHFLYDIIMCRWWWN